MELRGLPGTSEPKECAMFSSVTGALRILRNGLAATAADAGGAINIWKDDAGDWRCLAMRMRSDLDSQTFKTLGAVEKWTKEWMERIK